MNTKLSQNCCYSIPNLLSINHKKLLDDTIMNEIDKVLDNKPTPEQDLL